MSYGDTLGQNLRDARTRAGFSLAAVEKETKGEFKASVVGAYERGERAITVVRCAHLCRVYGTSAQQVIP